MEAGAVGRPIHGHDQYTLDLPGAAIGTDEGRARRLARLTWAFVGLGVLLRLLRYAMNFPLWGDESFVAINFIARGYRDLLRPLDYGQICPLLFLWIERWIVVHLGYSEWTLRLFPLACGMASVLLFRRVAGRIVGGLPLLLAVAIFAVAFHPIRHAAEVKPYASDLLVALVLLGLALEWRRAPNRTAWLWLLVAAVPIALALSHPAVFIAGGVSLALAPSIVRRRRRGEWVPFVLYQLALGGTFLGLFVAFTRYQEQVALKGLRVYWARSFPPLDGAGRLLRWLVEVHTGTMFAYPGGGRDGLSTPTFLAVVAASVLLWRRGRRGVVVLLLAPFALALVAATLHRYPYGDEARQMQFVAPAICILAGLGAAWLLEAVPWRRARPGLRALAVVSMAGFGLVSMARDVTHPYRFVYDQRSREFARRFWPAQARKAELACLRSDYGIAKPRSKNLRTALFVCNQWIYSPQRRHSGGPRLDAVTPDRPLRCVLYDETSPDQPEVVAWLAGMQQSLDLRRSDRVEIETGRGATAQRKESLIIYEFVPRSDTPAANPTVAGRAPRPETSPRR
jgi:hypothetical protein